MAAGGQWGCRQSWGLFATAYFVKTELVPLYNTVVNIEYQRRIIGYDVFVYSYFNGRQVHVHCWKNYKTRLWDVHCGYRVK